MHILGNTALVSLDGIEQTTDIRCLVQIQGNAALTSISSLRNVQRMGALLVFSNPVLIALDLPSLQTIDESLSLISRLTSLSGLRKLTRVGTTFSVDPAPNPVLPPDEIAELRARLGK